MVSGVSQHLGVVCSATQSRREHGIMVNCVARVGFFGLARDDETSPPLEVIVSFILISRGAVLTHAHMYNYCTRGIYHSRGAVHTLAHMCNYCTRGIYHSPLNKT